MAKEKLSGILLLIFGISLCLLVLLPKVKLLNTKLESLNTISATVNRALLIQFENPARKRAKAESYLYIDLQESTKSFQLRTDLDRIADLRNQISKGDFIKVYYAWNQKNAFWDIFQIEKQGIILFSLHDKIYSFDQNQKPLIIIGIFFLLAGLYYSLRKRSRLKG